MISLPVQLCACQCNHAPASAVKHLLVRACIFQCSDTSASAIMHLPVPLCACQCYNASVCVSMRLPICNFAELQCVQTCTCLGEGKIGFQTCPHTTFCSRHLSDKKHTHTCTCSQTHMHTHTYTRQLMLSNRAEAREKGDAGMRCCSTIN